MQFKSFKSWAMASSLLAGLATAPGFAQEAEELEDDLERTVTDVETTDETDTIVVTGSRIQRTSNYTSVGPVNTLSEEQIELSAVTNIGDLLQELPSVQFTGDGTNVNNGSGGLTTLNLRGLGSERVLTLLNGRRVSPVGSGINSLVDLSIFPVSVIDRVEVLKDGAAAVYGADAVSGVVNVISKRDFEGFDVSAQVGTSEEGDAEQWSIGAAAGVSSDRGNIMVGLGYQETEPVFQGDREVSECPYLEPFWGAVALRFGIAPPGATDPTRICSGSSFIPAGQFSGFTVDGGALRPFSFFGGDAYNFNPSNYLRTPSTMLNAISTARYDVTDNVEAIIEVLYSKRRSTQFLAPVPMGDGAQFTYGLVVPASNPFNLLGVDTFYRKRMLDVGPRIFDQESDTFRVLVGLDGTLPDMGVSFLDGASWEVSYSADVNNGTDVQDNLIDMLRVEQALDTQVTATSGAGTVTVGGVNYQCADPVARSLGCVPLNLFGEGSITPEAAEWIRLKATDRFSSTGEIYQAVISNEVFSLPAGDVSVVLGVEARKLQGRTDIDGAIENGYSSGNPAQSTSGQIENVDYFGEIEVPLVAGQPFFEELTFSGAYRYSDFEQFDAGDVYRLSLAWAPIEDLRFRGTLSTSYRAPSLSNLFNGGSGGFPTYDDPCGSADPADIAAATAAGVCASEGVTPGVFVQTDNQTLSFLVGSEIAGVPLEPEEGDAYTLGAVYRPTTGFLGDINFAAAVDYYRIEVTNAIGTLSHQTILDRCYLQGDASACALVTRRTGGDILRVDTFFINEEGEESSEGIDFTLDGSYPVGPGELNVNLAGTYTIERVNTDEDGNTFDFVGFCRGFTSSCVNEWRVNTTFTYALDRIRAAWQIRYLSEIDGDKADALEKLTSPFFGVPALGTPADFFDLDKMLDPYTIGDYFYHDANVKFNITDVHSIAFGVNNVFDQEPPFHKHENGFFNPTENTPNGTYDTVGRFFYVQWDSRF